MHSFPLKLSVAVLTLQVFPTHALTILNDADLPAYTTTGISTSTDDIEILTTSSSPSPQINTTGGVGLGASSGHTLTVNSTNKFVVQSNATGGYNAFIGARALGGNLHSKSELEFNFVDGRGIYVPNGGVATFDKKVTINTTGQSIGVMAYSTSATGGKVHFKDELIINASGDGAYGLVTQQGDPNGDGPELIFDKKVSLKLTGNDSVGISTQSIAPSEVLTDSLIHLKDGLDLEINDGVAISASLTRSKIQIDGESRIITKGSKAIEAIEGQVSINGKSTIIGDIEAVNTGHVSLDLSNGSSITGVMNNYTVTPLPPERNSSGLIDLNLQGSDSSWNLTGNSYINTLSLNGSAVIFNGAQKASLTTESLSGNGTFGMQANVVDGTGDKLIVTGTSSGDHLIKVKDDRAQATTGNETLTLIETADAGAAFNITNKTELGGYLYKLRQNGNNWELYSVGELSPTSDKTLSFLNTSYLLNYAETQTLLQRMGELRQSENANGDVWVRAFTGKFDSFGSGKLSGFDMDYTGVQVGVDKRLNIHGSDVYLGVMGGTSKADANYKEGDGNVTGYHAGIYGSYVAANDFYVDSVLKYSHFKNSFNVNSGEHGRIDSNVSSDGVGLSVEVGKRFYFAPSKSGYYLEPQAQLSYAHQGSASTVVDGLRVNMDSYDSTLGRVSAVAGYEVKNSKNPMNVYFKTGYVTEMSGNTSYSLNGNKENHDFGGDWWENSIGITAQLNKQHNLYLEGTYSSGNKFDQMQVNAGYRYSF